MQRLSPPAGLLAVCHDVVAHEVNVLVPAVDAAWPPVVGEDEKVPPSAVVPKGGAALL